MGRWSELRRELSEQEQRSDDVAACRPIGVVECLHGLAGRMKSSLENYQHCLERRRIPGGDEYRNLQRIKASGEVFRGKGARS